MAGTLQWALAGEVCFGPDISRAWARRSKGPGPFTPSMVSHRDSALLLRGDWLCEIRSDRIEMRVSMVSRFARFGLYTAGAGFYLLFLFDCF